MMNCFKMIIQKKIKTIVILIIIKIKTKILNNKMRISINLIMQITTLALKLHMIIRVINKNKMRRKKYLNQTTIEVKTTTESTPGNLKTYQKACSITQTYALSVLTAKINQVIIIVIRITKQKILNLKNQLQVYLTIKKILIKSIIKINTIITNLIIQNVM